MAVPTITSITPTKGPSGGRNLVEIVGTNFRLTAGSTSGPAPTPPRDVRVKFAAEEAIRVEVISATLLRVIAPAYRGSGRPEILPAVDVEVANLDSNNVLIPGELVTSVAAYTYQRAGLREPEPEAPWSVITREAIRIFRRQIIPNIVVTTHTDYTKPDRRSTAVAELPVLVLGGPTLRENRRRTVWSPIEMNKGGGRIELTKAPLVEDFTFDLTGLSDNVMELQALMTAVAETFERTPWLYVDDPTLGRLKYPFELTVEPALEPAASDSNLRQFTAAFEIWGVAIQHAEPYAVIALGTPEMQVQQGLSSSPPVPPEVIPV